MDIAFVYLYFQNLCHAIFLQIVYVRACVRLNKSLGNIPIYFYSFDTEWDRAIQRIIFSKPTALRRKGWSSSLAAVARCSTFLSKQSLRKP